MFLAGPDGHRLESVDGRIQPMCWRYVPEHACEKIRAACEAAEERRLNRPIPERYRALFEEDGKDGAEPGANGADAPPCG